MSSWQLFRFGTTLYRKAARADLGGEKLQMDLYYGTLGRLKRSGSHPYLNLKTLSEMFPDTIDQLGCD